AEEGELDGDQGDRRLRPQPRLDTARAYHAFDRGRPSRGREYDACRRDRCREANHEHPFHDRFSSDCRVLTRYPVTERRRSSQVRAAFCTASAVTARMRSGQARTFSTVCPVASAEPYQRATVAWLSSA